MMDLTSGTPWETVTLTTLSRDRILFPKLLNEARLYAKQSQMGKVIIYTAWGPEWRPFGQPRNRRLLESVVLDRGIKERILKDLVDFMERGRWYAERGLSKLAYANKPSYLSNDVFKAFLTDEEFYCTVHQVLVNHPSFKP